MNFVKVPRFRRALDILSRPLGRSYFAVKTLEERARVWGHNRLESRHEAVLLRDILRISRRMIFRLVALFLVVLFLDLLLARAMPRLRSIELLQSLLSYPTKSFIRSVFSVTIAAVSSLLGILFALYAVGFQISTQRYSAVVADFVNSERVGKYFFRLLVLADLYAVLGLLEVEVLRISPLVALATSVLLTVISLLGVIVFKDDYILKFKPLSLFQRAAGEFADLVQTVARPGFRAKSPNLASQSRQRADQLIDVMDKLFRDLLNDHKPTDAAYAPLAVAAVLANYLEAKKTIEEKGGWFPSVAERPRGSDLTLYPVKARFEMLGVGPFSIEKPDMYWVEDSLFRLLRRFRKAIPSVPQLAANQIIALETLLAGSRNREPSGNVKSTKGAFENQELHAFDEALKLLFESGRESSGASSEAAYLNALNSVRTVVADGFSLRVVPGRVVSWRDMIAPYLDQFHARIHPLRLRRQLRSSALPRFLTDTLLEQWSKAEIEIAMTGRIVTPTPLIRQEIYDKVSSSELETVTRNLRLILGELQRIARVRLEANERAIDHISIAYYLLAQLLDQEKDDVLWHLLDALNTFPALLISCSEEQVADSQIRDTLERLLLLCIASRRKKGYDFLLRSAFAALLVLLGVSDRSHFELGHLMRVPLVTGGLAFLVSELDQDPYWITHFAEYVETRVYKPGMALGQLLAAEACAEPLYMFPLKTQEIYRYRPFFLQVLDAVSELPTARVEGAPEFVTAAQHPSAFIRSLSLRHFADMEPCIEGFIEWMKRREQVKGLVSVLGCRAKGG